MCHIKLDILILTTLLKCLIFELIKVAIKYKVDEFLFGCTPQRPSSLMLASTLPQHKTSYMSFLCLTKLLKSLKDSVKPSAQFPVRFSHVEMSSCDESAPLALFAIVYKPASSSPSCFCHNKTLMWLLLHLGCCAATSETPDVSFSRWISEIRDKLFKQSSTRSHPDKTELVIKQEEK